MAARCRIQRHFALPAVVERYQKVYAELAVGTRLNMPSASLSHCAQ
jgi:hypothetical protein